MTHEQQKQTLMEQAKQLGMNKGDIKVLSTDPFYVGTDKDYEDAKWAAGLWDRMMSRRRSQLHLRGFHYWVQSQGIAKPSGELYAHNDPAKDWTYLLRCAQIARYLGIGKWENLVDLKHPDPQDYDNYFVGAGMESTGEIDPQAELNDKLEGMVDEFLRTLLREAPRYRTDGYQMFHLEVLCEKNSMGFVIEPACRRYNATYQPFVGQASVEKIDMMADRALKAVRAGKKVRIFYISDFDRYGASMIPAVARKIEFRTFGQDVDIKLSRLAMTEEQINKFKLPYAPKHGEDVVELDALEAIHPGELGKIVEQALKPYYDNEKPKVVNAENQRIRDEVRAMLDEKLKQPLQEAFAGIDIASVAGDFNLQDAVNPNFEPPEPEWDVDDTDGNWVLDTGRDFWTQLEEYKKYKAGGDEE